MNEQETHRGLVQRVFGSYWLSLVIGIALVGLGIASIIALRLVSTGLAFLLGIVLLVAAFLLGASVMNGVRPAASRVVDAVVGLLCVGAGVYLIVNPSIGPTVVALVLAVFFPVEGISKIVTAATMRHLPKWGWVVVSGVLSFALGVVVWVYGLRASGQVAGVLLGIDLGFTGLVIISVAGALRDYAQTTRHAPA